jgi:hypothetical protein
MAFAIYRPSYAEHAEWAIPVGDWLPAIDRLKAQGSPARDWQPIEVTLLRKEGGRSYRESDCPWYGSGDFMALRPAAVAVFEPFLDGCAELLPLRCADAELKLLNVWRLLDALDVQRSRIERSPSTGGIMRIESYVFDDGVIGDVPMFRLSAHRWGGIFLQQSIVDAVAKAGLREVSFERVSDAPIERWKPRQPRASISVADMQAATDEELWEVLYQALIPRLRGTRDDEYATVKSWSKGLQMLWATQVVDDEVNNGGFNQYFFNSSGQYAIEAIEGFELIGSIERAKLVRRAVDQLFRDAPRLREFYQQRTMEAFMESYKHTDLGAIDDEWFNAPEFFTARTRYIREHPEEFVIPTDQ